MSTPTTELDDRFSDPDASPISWEDTRRALEAAELFWISTVRADGRPHVTPLMPTPDAFIPQHTCFPLVARDIRASCNRGYRHGPRARPPPNESCSPLAVVRDSSARRR